MLFGAAYRYPSPSHLSGPLLLFFVLSTFIGQAPSSAQEKLTRSKAAQLIRGSRQFQNIQPLMKLFCVGDCRGSPNEIHYILQRAGYVKIGQQHTVGEMFGYTVISLTEKGRLASREWGVFSQDPGTHNQGSWDHGPSTQYTIIVARPQFVGVTGVRIMEQFKIAEVRYTSKYEPTSLGQELIRAGLDLSPYAREGEEMAMFSLYDDGWRLEDR